MSSMSAAGPTQGANYSPFGGTGHSVAAELANEAASVGGQPWARANPRESQGRLYAFRYASRSTRNPAALNFEPAL